MNLLKTPWLTVRVDGTRVIRIAPYQITASGFHSVNEIVAPRPDFRGALYQFLIGLLQTTFAPRDSDEWATYWDSAPSEEELLSRFSEYAHAFELSTTGPAFMQDRGLVDGESRNISAILIDAPGSKTLKDNTDHFVKREHVPGALCTSCAALALFTLQINAPGGGQGHRTGLRGGGPLTTLVLPPAEPNASLSLWKTLWLNVLTEEEVESYLKVDLSKAAVSTIFPWLEETRTSHPSNGRDTLPEDVHPFQMYWAMPRRIRLEFEESNGRKCGLCSQPAEIVSPRYRTKNYGINYSGPFQHPLTPYRLDPNNERPPSSIKGQSNGLSYRHWLGLIYGSNTKATIPALSVRAYIESKLEMIEAGNGARIWAFGYDMDNMKPLSWCDSTMPVVAGGSRRKTLERWAELAIAAADEAVSQLRKQVKVAWGKANDKRGNFAFLEVEFWQRTERSFYSTLAAVASDNSGTEAAQRVGEHWQNVLRREALRLFDASVISGSFQDLDMKKVLEARGKLIGLLTRGRVSKQLPGFRVEN